MSTAPAVEAPTTTTAPAKGKKKLIIIIAAVSVVLLGGAGGAFFVMKKNAAAAEAAAAESEGEGEAGAAAHGKTSSKSTKHDAKTAPTFVPLDPFTVNLADRDAERYAQIGITLEIEDPHTADLLKAYMPAVRNNILMAIADRNAADLMGREGKARLAERIIRETSRALGADVPEEEVADDEAAAEDATAAKKKKKKKAAAPDLPIRAVHFSNFIIQ
ncbi:MAG: flagellar basal body-associated FliL family protein [Rubrivivax sp.]|jgi:flagellar FliL protein|nr:flagellar basal body-associated FliL family protein [Rubrivivax sp.]